MAAFLLSYSVCSAANIANIMGAPRECTRVLFIGNSLTYVNDLPRMFAQYVEARYPAAQVCTEMVASGGATLADHHKSGDAASKLLKQKWDYVVIQEGRDTLPGGSLNGRSFYTFPVSFLAEASFFSQAARDAGAAPILFETWSAEQGAFEFLDAAFVAAQDKTGALIAPIGRVWNGVTGKYGLKLLRPDGLHPSEQGSMLAAMTLARTIFGEPEKGASNFKSSLDSNQFSAIDHEIAENAKAGKKLLLRHPVVYGEDPTLQASDPLDLRPGDAWKAKSSGFRYSLGSSFGIDQSSKISILNYAPSGAVPLPIKGEIRAPDKLTFETLTGGVEYSVAVVRKADLLTVMTSYQSDKTHRVFSTNDYSLTQDSGYFGALEALYARLSTDEKRNGLAHALSNHYARLRDFLGPDGLIQATSGFGLDEWDCIMVAWVYEDKGNLDRAVDYLRAAVAVYPDSLDARLSLADMLIEQGKKSDAIAALKDAASRSWPSANEEQQIQKKLASILELAP